MYLDYRKGLLELIAQDAYIEEQVTLASGQQSNFYVEMSNVLTKPFGIQAVGRLMIELIWRELGTHEYIYSDKHIYLAGTPLGGIVVSTGIIAQLHQAKVPNMSGIFIRKETPQGCVFSIEGFDGKLTDKFIVIEDVLTTGGSALRTVRLLQTHGFDVIAVFAVVNRLQGAYDNIQGKHGIRCRWLYDSDEIRSCHTTLLNSSSSKASEPTINDKNSI